MTVVHVNTAP